MRAYEYRHIVSFADTNLVGNVYYANHVLWQGRCREMFLRDHAPDVLDQLSSGLALITTRCGCEYLAELQAFDEIAVRMRLAGIQQNRIALNFEYWKLGPSEILAARGYHEIACCRREGDRTVPTKIPASLRAALRPFEVLETV
ncbi:MAG: acyl-CoA thioesterase [Planctomycetales bacterium]|nr:acyl-CoA thioesterase [Planctomycetales bacterium]